MTHEQLVPQDRGQAPGTDMLNCATADQACGGRSGETVYRGLERGEKYLGRIATNVELIEEGSKSVWLVDLDPGFLEAMDSSATHAAARVDEIRRQLQSGADS